MYKINEDLSIYVTRGDTVLFDVKANDSDGTPHTFMPGDLVRIKVYKKKKAEEVVLQKDFHIAAPTQKVQIYLSKEDTKIGEVISKPVTYWYSIALINADNEEQTIIGYDDEMGAKTFVLLPEGGDKVDEDTEQEAIPPENVDNDIDINSLLPVSNQAVARAILRLEAGIEALADKYVTPQFFGAIGDGEADDTEAFVKALATGRKVFVPAGIYAVSSFTIPEGATLEMEGNVHNTHAENVTAKRFAGTNAVLVLNGTIEIMPHVTINGGVLFTKGTAFLINVADHEFQGVNVDGVTVIGDGSQNAIGVMIDASDNDTTKKGYLTLSTFNMLINKCYYGYRIYRPQTTGREPWITFVNFKGSLTECYQGISTEYGTIAHANGSGVYDLVCCGGSIYKNSEDAYIDISGDMPVVNCLFSDFGGAHSIKYGLDLTGTRRATVHNYQQGDALIKSKAYYGERYVSGGMLVELTNSAMPNAKVYAVRSGGSIDYYFTGTFSSGTHIDFGASSPYVRAAVDTTYRDVATNLLIQMPGSREDRILVSNETGADITLLAPIVISVPHLTVN